jgi:hypothetical protein
MFSDHIVYQMNEGETSAPPLLTEADLIALMDKHGIGRAKQHSLIFSFVLFFSANLHITSYATFTVIHCINDLGIIA